MRGWVRASAGTEEGGAAGETVGAGTEGDEGGVVGSSAVIAGGMPEVGAAVEGRDAAPRELWRAAGANAGRC